MHELKEISAEVFANITLISATFFVILWFVDSVIHGKLVNTDITPEELKAHRIILVLSHLMMLSLVLAYWFPFAMIPVFLALFITRTAHEFIDELHWHADRCDTAESFIHMGMWVSILTNTITLAIWAFFYHYKGVPELPVPYIIWAVVLLLVIGYVSFVEFGRKATIPEKS